MADTATPSVKPAGTIDAGAQTPPAAANKTVASKPEKPDDDEYKTSLAKAEKELSLSQERMKLVKAKLDLAKPNNEDSPVNKRRVELRSEMGNIRTQQQSSKSSRGQVLDKIKRLDEQLKSRITEQKSARSKVNYKSVDDVQSEIGRLQQQVDTGMMKLVDEKKALAEITSLNKQKKGFAGFDQAQKGIDDVKAQIAELRKSMDDPETKALSDRYTEITTELDKIKAEQDDVYKSLNALRDERTKAHNEQQIKFQAVRDIKDKYYQAKRANAEYEKEAYRIRKERQNVEREAYLQGKRKQVASQKLEDASERAYQDEILTAQGLIRYFDPSSVEAKAATGPGKFAAPATRTVDESAIKGTRLAKKPADGDDSYFVGTGGKKGKKGKKGRTDSPAGTPAEGKFNMSIGVIEELAKVDVEPPMNQGDVPAVVEKLKEKLEHWKGDQDRKTKENIAKAQKEIDRLEAEATSSTPNSAGATETARKPAAEKQAVNGSASAGAELEQEKDAAADVADDLEKAKIEDATAPES